MLAYLRIAVGMPQEEDPYRIANRPFRGISHAEVGNSRAWEMVQEDVQFLKKFTAEAAIRYIRNIVGYDRFLREYANERGRGKRKLQGCIVFDIPRSKRTGIYDCVFAGFE